MNQVRIKYRARSKRTERERERTSEYSTKNWYGDMFEKNTERVGHIHGKLQYKRTERTDTGKCADGICNERRATRRVDRSSSHENKFTQGAQPGKTDFLEARDSLRVRLSMKEYDARKRAMYKEKGSCE